MTKKTPITSEQATLLLSVAAREGWADVARFALDSQADMNTVGPWDGLTPFQAAAYSGHAHILELCLKHGVAVNDRMHGARRTALHFASSAGHKKSVQTLLKNGANFDLPDKYGITALHLAAGSGHDQVVALLLEHGANVNVKDNNGYMPLHESARFGHLEVTRLLIQRGAAVNIKDEKEGKRPLDYARNSGQNDVVNLLLGRRNKNGYSR